MFASDGKESGHEAFARQHGLCEFEYVISELLGISYGVSKLPYGVLIDEQGKVASLGIVNSREHIDSLFEAREQQVASIQEYVAKQNTDSSLVTEVR